MEYSFFHLPDKETIFIREQKKETIRRRISGIQPLSYKLSLKTVILLCKLHWINLYARSHCRCKSYTLQVLTFNGCRSYFVDCIDKRLEVVR